MNSAADALQTFRQGRADAYTHDAATLVVVADNDKDARLLNEPFQISDAAIGVRKNSEAWRDFLSASVSRMREEHLFRGWVQQFVPQNIQGYYISVFEQAKPAEAL
jgi:polar amino acid transport system substrate-binding protein